MSTSDWVALFLSRPNSTWIAQKAEYRESEVLGELVDGFVFRQKHDRRIWRIVNLLKERLNQAKGRPGEKGQNQAEIRVVAESIYDETERRLHGQTDGIDALLDQAEKSAIDRERWLTEAITPPFRKQLELMVKMAA